MIVNNYRAMIAVAEELHHAELDIETLTDLHVTITTDTSDAKQVGRLRTDKEEVVLCDPLSDIIYQVPPPQRFMRAELSKLLSFANDSQGKQPFGHPIAKAVMIHFWLGCLHPFVDGNGRIASVLLYWYLLRKGYWTFSYLPISRVIKNSPAQYRDACIYTEQDDNDMNFFIDYHLRKIGQAKRDFESYVKRKESENRKMAALVDSKYHLNERQIQLLKYFHKYSDGSISIRTHANVYNVSRPIARHDPETLELFGLRSSEKVGRDRPFRGTPATAKFFQVARNISP